MAETDEHEQNLAHIHWMDYFAYSPFWDSKSNNNVLRTQRRVENPTYGHAQEKHELDAFRSGFEYVVAHALPPALFVVHRRDVRPDGARARPSAAYFILHDRVYMSPSLHDVVSTRLQNATALIGKTFAALSAAHPPSNPRAQSAWRAAPKTAADVAGATGGAGAAGAAAASAADAAAGAEAAPDTPGAAAPSTPAAPAGSAARPAPPAAPSFALARALQATRAALPDLDALSRAPRPAADPAAELRALDAALLGDARRAAGTPAPSGGGGGGGTGAGGAGGAGGPTLSVPAASRAGASGVTPALTAKGSIASPMPASPLVRAWPQA